MPSIQQIEINEEDQFKTILNDIETKRIDEEEKNEFKISKNVNSKKYLGIINTILP